MLSPLLIALLSGQTAPAAPAAPGTWVFKETADATTGNKSASATVRTADGKARLIVRCDVTDGSYVSVQFIPTPRAPAMAARQVTVTFDESRAELGKWDFPGLGAFASNDYDVFMLASQIAAAKTVRIAYTDDLGEVIEGRFQGPGSDAMFRQVFAACGRPYAVPVVAAPTRP